MVEKKAADELKAWKEYQQDQSKSPEWERLYKWLEKSRVRRWWRAPRNTTTSHPAGLKCCTPLESAPARPHLRTLPPRLLAAPPPPAPPHYQALGKEKSAAYVIKLKLRKGLCSVESVDVELDLDKLARLRVKLMRDGMSEKKFFEMFEPQPPTQHKLFKNGEPRTACLLRLLVHPAQ